MAEEQQLNELSKKTLGSYTRAAAADMAAHQGSAERTEVENEAAKRKARRGRTALIRKRGHNAWARTDDELEHDWKQYNKRSKGIERATKRLEGTAKSKRKKNQPSKPIRAQEEHENMRDLVELALSGNAVKFKDAVYAEINRRVTDRLDDRKLEVASDMFGDE